MVKGGPAHQIEMDDVQQSISIVSTTQQKITIDPLKIELSNAAGTLTITMDDKSGTITIKGAQITLSAAASIELDAASITLSAKQSIAISADATCSIRGPYAVTIN